MLKKSSQKREYVLDRLNCANCAAKIEARVARLDGVIQASVNFAARTLTVEAAEQDFPRIFSDTKQIVSQLEPGVAVLEKRPDETDARVIETSRVIRLVSGLLLFLAAFIFGLPPLLELLLFLLSYLLIGGSVLIRAARNIVRGQVFDENFLMSLATIGAFAIRAYPEAVAVMLFYEIGEILEGLAVGRSRRSISALLDIRPEYANLLAGSNIVRVKPEQVKVGDRIAVKPGERIPLDGRIAEGSTLLDTSAITGESIPRAVSAGDEVFSGSINRNSLITVEVAKVFSESTVSRILDLVQNAGSKKAPTEKFITRFAHRYTPVVVILAILLAVIPPLVIPGASFSDWLYRALAFLVVSCPCALVISIPLGYFGGIGAASKNGILVKGSNYLEALTKVDTVIFDKTGTLTRGIFSVAGVRSCLEPGSEHELLKLAAHAEFYSNHPIAKSIVEAYGSTKINPENIREFSEVPGYGVKAIIGGLPVLAGNAGFLESENIPLEAGDDAGTVVHLAVNQKYAGSIVIADEIKSDARQAIQRLRAIGLQRVVMLTGDARTVGEQIAQDLGISEVHAELLPGQKVEVFESIVKAGARKGKVAFVGDGINDAPVLARSDVGISMGALGSDAAIEAADVVIMTDHPSKVADAILIARKTNRIVWQNIIFAFAIKATVLIMSAGGVATLWEAVFADMGVALIAIFNAIRVLNFQGISQARRPGSS